MLPKGAVVFDPMRWFRSLPFLRESNRRVFLTTLKRRLRRPGRFEYLERRDLLSAIRFVAWNTLNQPTNVTQDAAFRTVLEAIGNESILGSAKPLDIISLAETDSVSVSRLEAVLDSLYGTTAFEVATSSTVSGDATGFIYDSRSVALLETSNLSSGLTHPSLRGKFRPVATSGESDFYAYAIHLKAGGTASDRTRRGNETALLRSDADALGDGASIVFGGDFNMLGSSEVAWTNLLAPGPASLSDTANAPGEWANNSAFKSLHTQNSISNLRSRLDFHFISDEFSDGTGLDFVDGSYRVLGNNGTHTMNGSITTGTGATPAVLNALVGASDHLPVISDFAFVNSAPQLRLNESGGLTRAVEGGAFDTITVQLSGTPTANVAVSLAFNSQLDLGGGPGSAISLQFTPQNAGMPQTVVVRAHDDNLNEGNHSSTITATVTSDDLTYVGLTADPLIVNIVDNDAPTIVINEIDSQTPGAGTDLAEFVELYDGGVGNVSLNGHTIVFYNGSNDLSYYSLDLDGFTTDSNGFFLLGNPGVAGVAATFPNSFLQNGADAVALYAADAAGFPNSTPIRLTGLLDAIVYDNGTADDLGLLPLLLAGEPQINENQNSTADTVSISRIPDGGERRRTSTYRLQAPTPGSPNLLPAAGVTVLRDLGGISVTEGDQPGLYSLVLDSIPAEVVSITITPDMQVDLGAGPGTPVVRVFTPANALTPQWIPVTASDDLLAEGIHTSTIVHSIASLDSRYQAAVIPAVVVRIVDNDQPAVVISEIMYNPATSEGGPGLPEWVEIVNQSASTVAIGGWRLDDEDALNWGAIPADTFLVPGQVAVLFDTSFTSAANFRSAWSVPVNAHVIGVTWSSLGNSPSTTDEILELLDATGTSIDIVNFDDDGVVWPSDSPEGASIVLTNLAGDNNQGSQWRRAVAGTNNARNPTGVIFSATDVGSPGFVPTSGSGGGLTLDTEDSTGVVLTPGWSTSTSVPGFQGNHYSFARAGTSATATFTPTLTTAGVYEVFVKYSAHPNRASNASVSVVHAGGIASVLQNQRTGGGVFRSLGQYDFSAGTSGKVLISAAGSNGFVTADAVQFVRLGNSAAAPTGDLSSPFSGMTLAVSEINASGFLYVTYSSLAGLNRSTIEDAGPEFVLSGSATAGVVLSGGGQLQSGTTYRYPFSGLFVPGDVRVNFIASSFADSTGKLNNAELESFQVSDGGIRVTLDNTDAVQTNQWARSASVAGYLGSDYLFNFSGGAGRLTYAPHFPASGSYEIFVNYTSQSSRASNAAYEILSQQGTSVVRIDQRMGGGSFQSLGRFNFLAGPTGSVTLRANDADGVVVGDAVRFVRVGDVNGAPSVALSQPLAGSTVNVTTINARGYIEVTFTDGGNDGLATNTILDAGAEITLTGSGVGNVSVSGVPILLSGTTYRYAISGSFTPGTVDAFFTAGGFQDNAGRGNIATLARFTIGSAQTEIVVDNTDAGFVASPAGQFVASTNVSGFLGSNYLAAPVGSTATATWTPSLPQSGNYQVYVRYTAHPMRATNATYVVNHNGGASTLNVDQTTGGSTWVLLGTFAMVNGAASVRLQTQNANQFVVADAVRFVLT